MGDFFSFRRMLTPVIIQIIFWLGVAVCVIGGIVTISSAFFVEQTLMGIVLLIFGPIIVRIYCEIFMVVFKINDSLTDIRNHVLATKPEPRT